MPWPADFADNEFPPVSGQLNSLGLLPTPWAPSTLTLRVLLYLWGTTASPAAPTLRSAGVLFGCFLVKAPHKISTPGMQGAGSPRHWGGGSCLWSSFGGPGFDGLLNLQCWRKVPTDKAFADMSSWNSGSPVLPERHSQLEHRGNDLFRGRVYLGHAREWGARGNPSPNFPEKS